MALTETRSNETVKKWKDFSKSTYAGVDISVIATLNFSVLEKFFTPKSSYSNKDKEKLKGIVHELGTVQTVSCQAHRPKAPVRSLGNVQARGYTRGPRTIAGSMIFTVLNQHALREISRQMEEVIFKASDQVIMMSDQILPIDLTFLFVNEYGNISRMALYGVEFLNSGQTMSIEDLLLEEVVQFVALDMDPMSDAKEIKREGDGENITTGSMLLKKNFNEYQQLLERSGLRRTF